MEDDVLTFEQLRNIRQRERSEDTLQELDNDFLAKARDYLERKERTSRDGFGKEFVNIKNVVKDILDIRKKKILKLAFLSSKTSIAVNNLLPEEQPFFESLKQELSSYKNSLDAEVFGNGTEDSSADSEGEKTSYRKAEEEGVDGREAEELGDDTEAVRAGEAREEVEEGNEDVSDTTRESDDEEDSADEEDDGSPEHGGDQVQEGSDEEVLFAGDDTTDDDAEQERVSVTFKQDFEAFIGVDMESYGPFEEGESADIPADNAEAFVSKGKAERD